MKLLRREYKAKTAALPDEMFRMDEQLFVSIIKSKQAQAIAAAELNFELFAKEANSIGQAYQMVQAMLHYRFKSLKTTFVYASANDFYVLSRFFGEDGQSISEESAYFSHHAQIMELLEGKVFIFFNGFMLREQNAGFAGENTCMVCLVPLTAADGIKGYIILESDRDGDISVTEDEEYLLYTARKLSEWISLFEAAQNKSQNQAESDPSKNDMAEANTSGPNTGEAIPAVSTDAVINNTREEQLISLLREVKGLDVDNALLTMGGLADVYLRTVRLFIRLTPNVAQTAKALIDSDLPAFGVQIHGLKGSLNNIGAVRLGAAAAQIEKAAKTGELAICKESYPPFLELLLDFHKRLSQSMPETDSEERPRGDTAALFDILEKVKEAADSYDAYEAAEILKNAREFSYGEEKDALIGEAASCLESYDCEGAAAIVEKIIQGGI
ncbi:MAG: Hpt domain-containing protein [Oscillospiraceae bacterium]|nr:Hpt domain-containing protein [Oscillospiraceae bacterium]